MAERLIDIFDDFSERLALRLLTPEFMIACFLIDAGEATPSEIMPHSKLSSTGFFNLLEKMKSKGLLYSDINPADRRSRILRLDEKASSYIVGQFKRYRTSDVEAFNSLGMARSELGHDGNTISRSVFISHLTCGYEILLYLYISPGLTNSQFVDIVDASETKFNSVLMELTKAGYIYSEADSSDRRRKRYFIAEEVRETLQELHRRVFNWLDAIPEAKNSGRNLSTGTVKPDS